MFRLNVTIVVNMAWSNKLLSFAVKMYFFAKQFYSMSVHCILVIKFPLETLFLSENLSCYVVRITSVQVAVLCKRQLGLRDFCTPENIERVKRSILQSPTSSALKYASVLTLSNHTVCPILNDDLHFHPFKMAFTQEIS